MRKKVAGKKLGRDIKKRRALFKGLITALVAHGKIKTTEAKAKAIKKLVDKLVTKAKRGSLHARHQVLAFFPKKKTVKKLFEEIAPSFENRSSSFTRIIKIGRRRGDNASMAIMEWIETDAGQKKKSIKKAKKSQSSEKKQRQKKRKKKQTKKKT